MKSLGGQSETAVELSTPSRHPETSATVNSDDSTGHVGRRPNKKADRVSDVLGPANRPSRDPFSHTTLIFLRSSLREKYGARSDAVDLYTRR